MQNVISFVNEHLNWEKASIHRNDYHDPPRVAQVGFHEDISPPRRLAAVARSGPRKAAPAQVGFLEDATQRRRLLWVVGSDLRNNSRGKDYLLRDWNREDRHSKVAFSCAADLWTTKLAVNGRRTRAMAEPWANQQQPQRLLPGSGWLGQCPDQPKDHFLVPSVQLVKGLNELAFSLVRHRTARCGDSFRLLIAFKEKLVRFNFKCLCHFLEGFDAGHSVPVFDSGSVGTQKSGPFLYVALRESLGAPYFVKPFSDVHGFLLSDRPSPGKYGIGH